MQAPIIESIDLQGFVKGSASERAEMAEEVDKICQSTGFLIVNNHGVPESVIDNIWTQAETFFDLPFSIKERYIAPDPECPRGYFPEGAEALAKSPGNTSSESPADLKESFGVGPLQPPPISLSAEHLFFHYGANYWPTEPKKLQQSILDYYRAMETLGSQLLILFASALRLDPFYFAPYHTHHMGALRLIKYPAAKGHFKPSSPGQLGAGEHSDYGSITILRPDPDVEGLEIRFPSGAWAKAPLVKNGFIINIGDMMSRWTNDRWVSTVHRVVQPGTDPAMSKRSRQSLAFFYNTNFDAKIECIETCLGSQETPHYPPVEAGTYLMQRFNAARN